MSIPRAVVPGRVYMLTRRCSERRFFLRPDAETNTAFVYCLALAAEVHQVEVIFTAAMSNHHHTGIVDVHGRLPDFLGQGQVRRVRRIDDERVRAAVLARRCPLALLEKGIREYPTAECRAASFAAAGRCCELLGKTDAAVAFYGQALLREADRDRDGRKPAHVSTVRC